VVVGGKWCWVVRNLLVVISVLCKWWLEVSGGAWSVVVGGEW
jgi:hypothetical protein